MPQVVVIDQIFIAQSQSVDALADEFQQRMFDEVGVSMIAEAGREPSQDARLLCHFPEQQSSGVGSDVAPSNSATTSRCPRP